MFTVVMCADVKKSAGSQKRTGMTFKTKLPFVPQNDLRITCIHASLEVTKVQWCHDRKYFLLNARPLEHGIFVAEDYRKMFEAGGWKVTTGL